MKEKYFELEAGCVAYRMNQDNEPEYLLVHRVKFDDFGFPKGHVEHGESLEEAAKRETLEEAGITGEIVSEIPAFEYRVDGKKKGTETDITYVRRVYNFLMEATGESDFDNSKIAEGKTEVHWCTYEDAMDKLSYQNVKTLLEQAQTHLSSS